MNEENCLTEKKFMLMLDIRKFFTSPKYKKKAFRSRNNIGQIYSNSQIANPLLLQLLREMQDRRFIFINDTGLYEFDFEAMDAFLEETEYGKLVLYWADELSMISYGRS